VVPQGDDHPELVDHGQEPGEQVQSESSPVITSKLVSDCTLNAQPDADSRHRREHAEQHSVNVDVPLLPVVSSRLAPGEEAFTGAPGSEPIQAYLTRASSRMRQPLLEAGQMNLAIAPSAIAWGQQGFLHCFVATDPAEVLIGPLGL